MRTSSSQPTAVISAYALNDEQIKALISRNASNEIWASLLEKRLVDWCPTTLLTKGGYSLTDKGVSVRKLLLEKFGENFTKTHPKLSWRRRTKCKCGKGFVHGSPGHVAHEKHFPNLCKRRAR